MCLSLKRLSVSQSQRSFKLTYYILLIQSMINQMRPNSANTQIVFNWMSSYLGVSAYFEIPLAHNSMANGFFRLSCFTY